MQPPKTVTRLLQTTFFKLFPIVDQELLFWREKALNIPNEELRNQALASMDAKQFHCQGGAVYALLAGEKYRQAIRFIVAYQTISDYLDNLCDRSTSLDPQDFRMLHEAMKDALSPGNPLQHYYAFRSEQDDGGYLQALVLTCQNQLKEIDDWNGTQEFCLQLEGLYADLQVHKHVQESERVPRLVHWYRQNKKKALGLRWYEFAAASGSTLGIFCLVSYAFAGKMTKELAERVIASYFPAVQTLHILLDYYIDQLEDEREGDLNFCSYYQDDVELLERLQFFTNLAEDSVKSLPDATFHLFIPKGLVALYLSDEKVDTLESGKKIRKNLLRTSGRIGKLIHFSIRTYYKTLKK